MNILKLFSIFLFTQLPICAHAAVDPASLASLISYGLTHSTDAATAKADVNISQSAKSLANKNRFIPQLELSAGQQEYVYDHPYNQNGVNVSNNGTDPSVGISATFDLQKIFGPDVRVSRASLFYARLQQEIIKRQIIRHVKKAYFKISEIRADVALLERQIKLFERVDGILRKQERLGVYNELEREQFAIQKGLLQSELSNRKADLEAAYSDLSTYLHLSTSELRDRIARITEKPSLHFASQNLTATMYEGVNENDLARSLGASYDLAKLEYTGYHSIALPSVYAKIHREWPSMPSGDGPQTVSEVGLSFPLDAFFTRTSKKSILAAKMQRSKAQFDKSMRQYHAAIRLALGNLIRFKAEKENLNHVRAQAEKLLKKSFLFYSQKRLDALGTLDIFQKDLDASRAVLSNNLKIELEDSNLEYLVGSRSL